MHGVTEGHVSYNDVDQCPVVVGVSITPRSMSSRRRVTDFDAVVERWRRQFVEHGMLQSGLQQQCQPSVPVVRPPKSARVRVAKSGRMAGCAGMG